MTTWNRRVWRITAQAHAAYGQSHQNGRDLWADLPDWQDLEPARRRVALAQARGWHRAAAYSRVDLIYDLEQIVARLSQHITTLRAPAGRTLPSLRTLYEELLAADGEFDSLELHGSVISVTTEPIVLEAIAFGRFEIRLDLRRLSEDSPYEVVALQPNPAASCAETTHPHVQADSLCAGEGLAAIRAALQEGRLFDFFTLVDRILHTYGEGSAYVELSRWFGTACHDCDAVVDEDDTCSCYACAELLCNDCLACCRSCGTGYCSNCIGCCAVCDDPVCTRCLFKCDHCRQSVCESCLEKSTCSNCMAEIEHELEQKAQKTPPTKASPASSQPSL